MDEKTIIKNHITSVRIADDILAAAEDCCYRNGTSRHRILNAALRFAVMEHRQEFDEFLNRNSELIRPTYVRGKEEKA